MNTHNETTLTFGTKAPALLAQGFDPVPVTGKAVYVKGWTTMDITEELVSEQANNGHASNNVGIRCSDTVVGIDVDVRDEGVAEKLHQWLHTRLGDSMLTRSGNKPKFLVPAHGCIAGLKKLTSATYTDEEGNKHQIEILGKGHQVVAYGIHPGTNEPYEWIDDRGPVETKQSPSDLPSVDQRLIDELFSEFDRLAKGEGWTLIGKAKTTIGDGTANLPVSGFTIDHAKALYEALLPSKQDEWENYDMWLREVLMPLHHQFQGSEDALALAHEISDQCPNYDSDTLEEKWDSLKPDAREAKTIRSIAWIARERTDWTPPPGIDMVGSPVTDDEFSDMDGTEGLEFATLAPSDLDARRVPTDILEADAWCAQRFFVLSEGNKPMVAHWWRDYDTGVETLRTYAFEDFKKLYSNANVRVDGKWKSVADSFLKNPLRKTYFDVILDVSGDNVPSGTLNLFRGWGVRPQRGADTSLIHQHIREVLATGDESLYEYILGWCANAFQNPARPGEVALVLQSGQGTGKGLFGHLLRELAGAHGMHINNPKHLTGEFNAHLEGKIVLFADEAFFAGDRSHIGVLKALLTDPTFTIRRLYKDAVQRKNMLHVVMATNEGWAVPAEIDDRRFAVIGVSEHRKGNLAYFKALASAMNDRDVQAAFLEELLTRNLSDFEVRNIPKTQARTEQQIHSLKGVKAWLYDRLSDGELFLSDFDKPAKSKPADLWPKWASTHGLHEDYGYWEPSQRYRQETYHVSPIELGKELSGIYQKQRETTGKRRHGYVLGSLDEARRRFCEKTGLNPEWEEA
jgi:hypothetical protein